MPATTKGISVNLAAFLDMIAWSEIGSQILAASDNGYNVLVGATPKKILTFPSYKNHPDILNEALDSTAAGRYQIEHHFWQIYMRLISLPDFGPQSQDAYAIQQCRESGALDDIELGNITTAIGRVAHIWASLPGDNYTLPSGQAQPSHSVADLVGAYKAAGGGVRAPGLSSDT